MAKKCIAIEIEETFIQPLIDLLEADPETRGEVKFRLFTHHSAYGEMEDPKDLDPEEPIEILEASLAFGDLVEIP